MALSMNLEQEAGRWTLTLQGELDYGECARFRMTIDRILRQAPPVVVIDLSALELLDSSGLGLLLALSKEYSANGGRLILVTNEAVNNILELTRLTGIFCCTSSLEQAEAMLADVSA